MSKFGIFFKNHDNATLALDQDKVIEKYVLSSETLAKGHVLVPLFTPGLHYRVAPEVAAPSNSLSVKARFGRLVYQSAIVAESAQIDEGVFANAEVTIGGAAAGVVVTIKSVPANTVFPGHPAKLVGRPIIGYGMASVPAEGG